MAQLTLFKSVYQITGGSNYTLITPTSISATTFDESGLVAIDSLAASVYSSGIYSVTIDADKYVIGTIYQIKWYIQYTSDSSQKIITNYFKFYLSANIANPVMIQVFQSPLFFPV